MAETVITELYIVSADSAVLVEARSSVGAISFGTTQLSGTVRGHVEEGRIDTSSPLSVLAEVPVASLQSGNAVYDSELRSRLDARRFPHIVAELARLEPLESGRYELEGDLTIHGHAHRYSCTASMEVSDGPTLLVSGSTVIDMRDYDIALPSLMMLRIYPDVTVHFRIKAAGAPGPDDTEKVDA
ncbi:MAG TPA: YceI family protein [Nocardioidaceae bacterium]|nr:YceI family protein [Nocardioidaceae bacterium]